MGKSIEIGTSPRLVITPGAGAEAQPMMLADAITCTVVLENKPLPCPPSPSTSSTTSSTCSSSSGLPKSSNPKKVRFGETSQAISKTIHCYHQPNPEDDDEEEEGRVSTWLSHADYKRIRDASFAVIREHKRQLKTGGTGIVEDCSDNDTATTEWTWRGFDYVLERHPRTMIRQTHCQDVLKFQQVLLCHCRAALATYAANSSATLGSEARALRLGQEMQLEGFQIHRPELSLSCAMTVNDKKQDDTQANNADEEDTNSVVDGSSNSYVAANYCDPSHPENLPRLVPFLWRAALQFFHCVY